ncbi:hypothetical protein CEXT_312581 [Caerostris extrusa]|uniref:Uncharacterized protein n=1 Tax=Caerostris extrusa TaxID=172846 RepID=A0AAV4TDI2_CAEEX|nr:hypothetical protein CEXT_312581 [Caerostris extrusa]
MSHPPSVMNIELKTSEAAAIMTPFFTISHMPSALSSANKSSGRACSASFHVLKLPEKHQKKKKKKKKNLLVVAICSVCSQIVE